VIHTVSSNCASQGRWLFGHHILDSAFRQKDVEACVPTQFRRTNHSTLPFHKVVRERQIPSKARDLSVVREKILHLGFLFAPDNRSGFVC
jgi:hypothetical protein